MQSSEALPEESCKAPGTEQQRQNILPVKSDPAYICPFYGSAQSSGQCCGRQLISDFYHRYHKRDQTIFDHKEWLFPSKAYPSHLHGIPDRPILLSHGREKPKDDRQWYYDLIRNMHPLHSRHKFSDCRRRYQISPRHDPGCKAGHDRCHCQKEKREKSFCPCERNPFQQETPCIEKQIFPRRPQSSLRQDKPKWHQAQNRLDYIHQPLITRTEHQRRNRKQQDQLRPGIECNPGSLPCRSPQHHPIHYTMPALAKCFRSRRLPNMPPNMAKRKIPATTRIKLHIGITAITRSAYSSP